MSNDNFKNDDAIIRAIKSASEHLVPPPDMLPSAWAEANVKIPVGNSIPGPISFENAPIQREPLDMMKAPGCYRITLQFGAQTGKTTILQCGMGYFIAHEPRSQIVVQPTQGDMQTFLETKVRPMFDANPSISSKMAKQRGREGVNNSRIISYVGGWLMMSWAGSPKTLRGRSAPITIADEIDGYDATSEGDPVQLLVQRSATFGDQRLLIESSTPTIKGESRVEAGFLAGDQRRFYIACPHCDEHQTLKWANVKWTGQDDPSGDQHPDTAAYACEACGVLLNDGERIAAIRNAESLGAGWKASRPFKGHASYHASELYSTFRRLRDIVQSYLDKLAVGDVQSFVNVSLGETYEETGEKADPDSLFKRREEYRAQVPAGGLFLTAGIDMQQDRLEVEVVAWGIGEESWSVEYRVLWGDPLNSDVWEELTAMLEETYQHESGAQLAISASCLDTGGTAGYTQEAYKYAEGKTGRRLFAIKGGGTWGSPVVGAPSRKQSGQKGRKVDLFIVGVDEAKLTIMRRLAQQTPGPGYCHFPKDDDHSEEYFKQITAEKLLTRYVKGFGVREWHKTRDRNEVLDCRTYAYAALKIAKPPLNRLAEKLKMPEKSAGKPEKQPEKPVPARKTTAENPPEEQKAANDDNPPVRRKKVQQAPKRRNFATNW